MWANQSPKTMTGRWCVVRGYPVLGEVHLHSCNPQRGHRLGTRWRGHVLPEVKPSSAPDRTP